MSAKHTTPEWQKTRKIIRAQVRATWARGDDAACWRCGGAIPEGYPYDVGHIDRFSGNGVDNAAPEHRTKTGACPGNRNLGGRIGARMTNATKGGTTFQGPPWA